MNDPSSLSRFARFAPAISGIVFCLAAFPSQAQQAPASGTATAEQPIMLSEFSVSGAQDKGYRAGNSVSATRIDTPIKDLPFAVTAFTEQFINDIGTHELADVLKYAPSVTSGSEGFSNGNSLVMVRGFQTAPQRNGFYSPSYVDGSVIQRVEVVKGPASLFYGQIAPGGVVNYITKRPTSKPGGSLSLQAGSYDYHRVQMDVNQPVVGDRVTARFNMAWENMERYVEKFHGDLLVLNPSLAIKVTDNSSLNVEYQWYRRNEEPQALMRQSARVPLSNAAFYPTPGNPTRALFSFDYFGHYAISDRTYNASSIFDYKRTNVETFTVDYQIHHGKNWTSRIGFDWDRSTQKMKQTGFGDLLVIVPASQLAGLPNDLQAVSQFLNANLDVTKATTTQVLRRMRYEMNTSQRRTLQAEITGKVQFGNVTWKPLFGYERATGSTQLYQSTLPTALWQPPWNILDRSTWIDVDAPIGSFALSNNTGGVYKNLGVYSANQLSLLEDRLIFVGGLRWSDASNSSVQRITNTPSPVFKTTKTTPQIGAGYKVTRDLMLYGSYSESFTGISSLLTTRGVVDRVAKPFLGKGYEAGMKTDFLDGRISGTLAYFNDQQENYIFSFVQIDPATGLTLSTQVQDGNIVKTEGVELEMTYSPTDHWQVIFSASSAATKYSSISSPDVQFLLGTPPQYTAKNRSNLWSRYSFHGDGTKGLWVGAGLNYTGKKAEISNNPWLYLPPQTIFDAVVGYDWKSGGRNWSTKLTWKNITNEDEIQTVRERGEPSRIIADLTVRF